MITVSVKFVHQTHTSIGKETVNHAFHAQMEHLTLVVNSFPTIVCLANVLTDKYVFQTDVFYAV